MSIFRSLIAALFVVGLVQSAARADVRLDVREDAVTIERSDALLSFSLQGGKATAVESPRKTNWLAAGMGGLEMHILDQYTKKRSDYAQAKFLPKVLKQTTGEAQVELSAMGSQGDYGFCRVSKIAHMKEGSPAVSMRFEFNVGSGAVTPQTQGFIFVGTAPGDTELIVPTEQQGLARFDAKMQPLVAPPAQGWLAVRRGNSGVAYVMPFEDIEYIGARAAEGGIKFVWRTVAQRVDVEETRAWDVTLIPYEGMSELHGASALGCGQIGAKGEVTVFSAVSGAAEMEVATRTDAKGKWIEGEKKQISLTPRLNHFKLASAIPNGTQVRVKLKHESAELTLYTTVGAVQVPLPLQAARMVAAPEQVSKHDIDYRDFSETPHVPWAKPLDGGKLSIFASWGELATNRMVNEVMQRVDAEVDTVTMASGLDVGWGLGGPLYGRRSNDDIRAALKASLGGTKQYDVIVLGANIPYDTCIGDEIGTALLERVRNGAGLVYGGMRSVSKTFADELPVKRAFGQGAEPWSLAGKADHPIVAGIPVNQMASPIIKYVGAKDGANVLINAGVDGVGDKATHNPLLVTTEFGKGRIVVLSGLASGEEGHALLTKAILWAARREPRLKIVRVGMTKESLPYGAQAVLEMTCAATPDAAGTFDAEASCDDWKQVIRFEAMKPQVEFKLPTNLATGRKRVDVRILQNGNVVNFGAAIFNVSPIGELNIALEQSKDAQLNQPVFAFGAPIKGSVKAVGAKVSNVELIDGLGRSLDRVTVDGDGKFTLSTKQSTRYEAHVVAQIRENGRVIQETRVPVYVGLAPEAVAWNEAEMLLYGRATGARANLLRDLVDPWASGFGGDLRATCNVGVPCGIAHVDTGAWNSLVSEYAKTKDTRLLYRVPCIDSDQYADLVREITRQRGEVFGKLRTLAYINGDEQSFTSYASEFDFDFSPPAIKEFRKYLQSIYRDIASLNSVWQEKYASFDEVMPPLTEQVRKDAKLLPAWNDFRTFNNISFTKGYRMIRDELRKFDPQARFGISGTQKPAAFGGHDYTRLMPVFDMLQEYGMCDEMQLALNPRTRLCPAMGYSATFNEAKSETWRIIAMGGGGVSYYNETSGIYPTLRAAPPLAGCAQAINDARDTGISMAMLTAEKRYDAVAVYYSHESINAGFIQFSDDNAYAKGMKWYRDVAAKLSITPGWLTREQLLKSTKDLKAIVLLNIYALSDEEAGALMQFMSRGGIVIADDRLGLTDLHLRKRVSAFPELRAAGNFVRAESMADMTAVKKLLRERVGIVPVSDVVGSDALLRTTVTSFQSGVVKLTAVHNGGSEPAALSLNGTAGEFVYDSRAGKLLGQGTVKFIASPNEAAVLTRLPYAVEGVSLDAPQKAAGGQVLQISASVRVKGAEAGPHIFAFRVMDPNGKTLPGWAWRVRGDRGSAKTTWFLPFNAAVGQWTVEVRDAATGATHSASFTVQ